MEPEENQSGIKPFVNLSDFKVLGMLLGEDVRSLQLLYNATEITKSVYEVNARYIKSTNGQSDYGSAFPIHPEVLEYAMRTCKGKVVLEIGGAGGENSILIVMAGAKRVYMNDIEQAEVEQFERLRVQLPEVSSRLESICCDIFTLLDKRPDLISQIDVVLCRNLLHFFTDRRLSLFFPLLKKLLKPNGEIIFSANSYFYDPIIKIAETNPEATRFVIHRVQFHDVLKSPDLPVVHFVLDAEVCQEDVDPLSFDQIPLYKKSQTTAYKWVQCVLDEKQSKVVTKGVRNKVNELWQEKKREIAALQIQIGTIVLVRNYTRDYTAQTLTTLFERHGFKINQTYSLGYNGHILDPKKSSEKVHQVGVIGTYLPE